MAGRRVVVTGIGTINPLGHTIEEYFSNLEKGVSAAATITRFDATKFRSRIACEIKDYDWTRYFDRKEVRKYDLFAQWAMISADEALKDACLVDNDTIDKERVGVVWASGTGGIHITLSGIVILVKFVQPSNAESPILMTSSGIIKYSSVLPGVYLINSVNFLLYKIPSIDS